MRILSELPGAAVSCRFAGGCDVSVCKCGVGHRPRSPAFLAVDLTRVLSRLCGEATLLTMSSV